MYLLIFRLHFSPPLSLSPASFSLVSSSTSPRLFFSLPPPSSHSPSLPTPITSLCFLKKIILFVCKLRLHSTEREKIGFNEKEKIFHIRKLVILLERWKKKASQVLSSSYRRRIPEAFIRSSSEFRVPYSLSD